MAADQAMYEAKGKGRNTVVKKKTVDLFFDKQINNHVILQGKINNSGSS
jgi:hypothetical protein